MQTGFSLSKMSMLVRNIQKKKKKMHRSAIEINNIGHNFQF